MIVNVFGYFLNSLICKKLENCRNLPKNSIICLASRKKCAMLGVSNIPQGSFGVTIRSSEIENNGRQLRGRLPALCTGFEIGMDD
jgi:hypothetical protein